MKIKCGNPFPSALAIAVLTVGIWALSSYGFVAAEDAPLVWKSTHVQAPPDVDGKIDRVWHGAKELKVTVREAFGGVDPITVVLRALHTDEALYILAQWPDTTRSDMRDPYIWNAAKNEYERPTTPDDQFAIEFPIEGDLLQSMLPSEGSYTADVWHWKAGRSNLGGWVDDKRHIISQQRIDGAKQYSLGGHNSVYVARPMDGGTAAYKTTPKPSSYQGDRVPSYEPQAPTGSLADIPGKGIHDGKGWTLELTRKFSTGNPDDAVIDPEGDNLCAVAVLNDELYWNHSVSQLLVLSFEK